jgi:hypothetical protein
VTRRDAFNESWQFAKNADSDCSVERRLCRLFGRSPLFAKLQTLGFSLLLQLLSLRFCLFFFFVLPFVLFVVAGGPVGHWPCSFVIGGSESSELTEYGVGGSVFLKARFARLSTAFWRFSFSR